MWLGWVQNTGSSLKGASHFLPSLVRVSRFFSEALISHGCLTLYSDFDLLCAAAYRSLENKDMVEGPRNSERLLGTNIDHLFLHSRSFLALLLPLHSYNIRVLFFCHALGREKVSA